MNDPAQSASVQLADQASQSARHRSADVDSHTHAERNRRERRTPQLASSVSRPLKSGERCRRVDHHHPLEAILSRWWMRKLLGHISGPRRSGKTMIEEIIDSYADPDARWLERLRYWPFHKFIDYVRDGASLETFRDRIGRRRDVIRGLVIAARSVAEFGLTLPQRFVVPMFAVWNFTDRCNLRCRHCYQSSVRGEPDGELTLAEKLDLADQIGRLYLPMVAFAGGEPTISPDLLPVVRRCHSYGIHMSLATNGTTMTADLAAQLAEAGMRYVEVSLDSVHPAKHEAFRGQPGMWRRTVRGMKHVVQQEGLRLGIAICVHQGNFDEVEDMLRFAVDVGASCVAHFNFIPVGRGAHMTGEDLTPRQREQLLNVLNEWMQSGKVGIISTSPQFGRVCLADAPTDNGRVACTHAGSGAGWKARVVAKYLGGCGAGRTYVAIEPNGDITPCVYMPRRVLGNVRARSFFDVCRKNPFSELLSDRQKRLHHCQDCTFKNYCGGCRARADAYYGRLDAGDPGCLFNERHWRRLMNDGSSSPPGRPDSAA